MDVLKGLFGSITSSILQLLVIAGTLALVYVFAIKPALDTTIEVSEQFSGGAGQRQPIGRADDSTADPLGE